MNKFQTKLQIGKSEIDDNYLKTIGNAFKTHKQVRIYLLKSASPDKAKVKKLAEEISKKLPFKTEFKTIGFTIVLMKI